METATVEKAALQDDQNGMAAHKPTCRFCGNLLSESFCDLGMSPPCQTHIEPRQLNHMEAFYPLHAWVCSKCFLVQLEEYVAPDSIFIEVPVAVRCA